MHKNNQADGMPAIAEQIRNNKFRVAIVFAAIVGLVGFYFLKSQPQNALEIHSEESYTLKNENMPIPTVVQPGVSVVKAEKEKPVSTEEIKARAAFVREKQMEIQQRITAPLMLVNDGTKESIESAVQDNRYNDLNPNTQFLQNSSHKEAQAATAIAMGSLSTIIAAGSFIHAILEPATNSDLPGSLRAIVSEPAYSEDGSQVLIPQGSRLIGEYKSGMLQGQSRIFIVWQRLITPEGISVQLGSGGVDSLGVSGMGADTIDRHFWERFGTASLLSMIGAGTATLGVSGGDQDNSASSYRTAISNSFLQAAGQSLQQDGSISPTLRTMQGKPIMVFVAKDLRFDDAIKSTKSSINIF